MSEFNLEGGVEWVQEALDAIRRRDGEISDLYDDLARTGDDFCREVIKAVEIQRQEVIDQICKVHRLVNPVFCREVKKIIERAEEGGQYVRKDFI